MLYEVITGTVVLDATLQAPGDVRASRGRLELVAFVQDGATLRVLGAARAGL